MPNQIMLLLFHPRLESSRVNRVIFEKFANNPLIYSKDMYELYPDFNIDVSAEQEDLMKSDIIIVQHPMYWYAAPPLYKQWIDLVLEHGWAYGTNGDKLKGKKIFHIVSSGGAYEAHAKEGKKVYTYHELMRPFELTYQLCQMHYLPPYIVSKANRITYNEIAVQANQISQTISKMIEGDECYLDHQNANYLNDLK